jgi:peroxiredoxin Q/BCP
MAQLRQDSAEFSRRGAAVIILGPDGPRAFKRYWSENEMPFIGLADLGSRVADRYAQEVNLIKLGRMPALFIIDKRGLIRFIHYGKAMSDIPANETVLQALDQLLEEDRAEIAREAA